MLDIGWTELLLVGIVALIVVGPQDLPRMFRTLGRMTAKAKGLAREFSSAMSDAARETGLDEATNTVRDLKGLTSKKAMGLDRLDDVADRFDAWEPNVNVKPTANLKPDARPAEARTVIEPVGGAAVANAPAGKAPVQDTSPAAPRQLHATRRSDAATPPESFDKG